MFNVRHPFRSVRARLTFWYALVLAVILLVYAGGVYVFLRQNLYAELDRRLHDDFEAAEEDLERRSDGAIVRSVRRDSHRHAEDGPGERWLEVWSLAGELLFREGPEVPAPPAPARSHSAFAEASPPSGRGSADRRARPPTMAGPERGSADDGDDAANTRAPTPGEETVRAGAGAIFRVRGGTYPIDGTPVLIRVARSEMALRHELSEFLLGMGLGLPAAVLLACLGGYFLAGRALKPVGRMAARARSITAERLGERLPIENSADELGQLGSVFNGTLARLEGSFEALRRFTSDAAHELRTPLTALRSVGEVGVRESRTADAYRDVIGSMLEEVDRLGRLVETLLTLSRSDSGRVEIRTERLELRQFARDAVEYLDVLADEKHQRIVVEGEPDVYVDADPRLLRQAASNILDNAIRHSPEGAPIRVVVYRRGEGGSAEAVLEVIDQGPGIEAEHQDRIFERFYRVDQARSREAGGAGLGLSIAQWAVQANGGSIELESRVGEGSSFRIRLRLDRQESTVP